MDEIGFLKKKNIEFESELNEARRDIDSYRQQIENMNKSKIFFEFGTVLRSGQSSLEQNLNFGLFFRSEKGEGKLPRNQRRRRTSLSEKYCSFE